MSFTAIHLTKNKLIIIIVNNLIVGRVRDMLTIEWIDNFKSKSLMNFNENVLNFSSFVLEKKKKSYTKEIRLPLFFTSREYEMKS